MPRVTRAAAPRITQAMGWLPPSPRSRIAGPDQGSRSDERRRGRGNRAVDRAQEPARDQVELPDIDESGAAASSVQRRKENGNGTHGFPAVGVVLDDDEPAARPEDAPNRGQHVPAVPDEVEAVGGEHAVERPVRQALVKSPTVAARRASGKRRRTVSAPTAMARPSRSMAWISPAGPRTSARARVNAPCPAPSSNQREPAPLTARPDQRDVVIVIHIGPPPFGARGPTRWRAGRATS